jgi:hypothetical protein
MEVIQKSNDCLYNQLAKSLGRSVFDERHNHGLFEQGDIRNNFSEIWRFPVIDAHRKEGDEQSFYFNEVTFVYFDINNQYDTVEIVGTFDKLYAPISLNRLADTRFFTLSCKIPKGEVHYYKFIADGRQMLDPVNPQRQILNNGVEWSRFFTHYCNVPLSFERWEWTILERLTDHILPFRTTDARRFLNNYYHYLDKQTKSQLFARAHLLDQSVGVVNFIDKLVAREENHRLGDYKICLEIIDQVLRKRNPFLEPEEMSREMYVDLYEQMGSGNVPDWDYQRYNNPRFFLQLLRRHTITGAFSHPKYGGNAEAAAWAFLGERYRDNQGRSLFNWQVAIEKPLGLSEEYYG